MPVCILLLAYQCAVGGTLSPDTLSRLIVPPPQPRPVLVVPAATLDTPQLRPRAVEYSDWYGRRLTIHRYGSYAMLPLFAAEFALGDRLLNGTNNPTWMRPTHAAVAGGLGTLFLTNTVTGVWNLYDSREDPAGRTRRVIHSALLLWSDAGFAWAGYLAMDARHSMVAARRHRQVALGSMALSTVGSALMWFWRD